MFTITKWCNIKVSILSYIKIITSTSPRIYLCQIECLLSLASSGLIQDAVEICDPVLINVKVHLPAISDSKLNISYWIF